MKTWQAALAHIGLGALQSMAAVPFFDGNGTGGGLANVGIQIGAQFGLAALQAFLAKQNSHTDPKGNQLEPTPAGGYISIPLRQSQNGGI